MPRIPSLTERVTYRLSIRHHTRQYENSTQLLVDIRDRRDSLATAYSDISESEAASDRASLFEECRIRSTLLGSIRGTWQFLSVEIMRTSMSLPQLSDDLESFLHITNWLTLKYFEHTRSHSEDLESYVTRMYEDVAIFSRGAALGGLDKQYKLINGLRFVQLVHDSPLQLLLDSLGSLCQAQYVRPPSPTRELSASPVACSPDDASESSDSTCQTAGEEEEEEKEEEEEPLPDPSCSFPTAASLSPSLTEHARFIACFECALSDAYKNMWRDDEKTDRQFTSRTRNAVRCRD
ncbi:hypothetical protein B0H21DRAFT_751656 [Amylocystis lapponica]|nr:hypothetical protein B0H21DRAFT_751656 [Amylocystis lapponica]